VKLQQAGNKVKKISEIFSEYFEHLKLFKSNAKYYLLSAFIMNLSLSGFSLLFNLFLKELNFPETIIGYRLSIYSLGSLIIAVPATLSAKRRDFRSIFSTSILILVITSLSQIFFTELGPLLTATIIGGMFTTYYSIAVAPFIMRNTTKKERTYLFSLNYANVLAAGIFGNIIAGFLPGLFMKLKFPVVQSYEISLMLMALSSFFALIFVSKMNEDRIPDKQAKLKDIFKIRDPSLLLKVTLPSFIVGMGAGLIIPFMNLYFKNRINLPVEKIGIIFSISQIFMFLGILLGPPLAKKFGKIRTVVITQFLSIPFMLILAFMEQYLLVAIAFFMRASLMNMAQPLTTNFAMEAVPENEQEITNSTLSVAWTFSWTITTAIGGNLIQHYGFTLPLVIAALLYVISSILYFIFFFKVEKIGEELEWSGN